MTEHPQNNFIANLIILRQHLLKCCYAYTFVLIIGLFYSNPIYHFLATPLLHQLPNGQNLIATSVAGPLIAPLKLTVIAALFITIPYIFYQLWSFVAPGLFPHEKKRLWPMLFSSVGLFYSGTAFCTGMSPSTDKDDIGKLTFTFQGSGALAESA